MFGSWLSKYFIIGRVEFIYSAFFILLTAIITYWLFPNFVLHIDEQLYAVIRQPLLNSASYRNAIALANHHYERILYPAIVLIIYLFYLLRLPKPEAKQKLIATLKLFLLFEITMLILKRLSMERLSPNINDQQVITAFGDLFTQLSFKFSSVHSFPSDHAFFAMFWILILSYLRLGLSYIAYALLFCLGVLPRFLIGAHWLSDIAAGIILAILCTSIYTVLVPFRQKL